MWLRPSGIATAGERDIETTGPVEGPRDEVRAKVRA
jgi:hypothetical protein